MARRVSTALAIFAFAVAIGCTNRRPAAPPDPGPPVVTVAKPVVKVIDQFTDLTGTLAPSKYVEIRSRVTGRIKKVEFADGKDVKEGKLLVLIDPAPFVVALAKAKSDVSNAEAKLEGAKAKEAQVLKATGTAVSDYEKITATADRKVVGGTVPTIGLEPFRRNLADPKRPQLGRLRARCAGGHLSLALSSRSSSAMAIAYSMKPGVPFSLIQRKCSRAFSTFPFSSKSRPR